MQRASGMATRSRRPLMLSTCRSGSRPPCVRPERSARSRARRGRGGGTTLPGRVLDGLAPRGVEQLADAPAARQRGRSRPRTARRRPARWPRRSSAELRLCRNGAGANLRSGIAAALVDGAAAHAELGLFECDEAALPAIVRARPAAHDRARQPVPRPARPLRRARGRRRALAHDDRRAARRDHARRLRRRPADGRPRVGPRGRRRVLRDRRPGARAGAARRTPPTRASASAAARRTPTPRSGSDTSATTAARAAATPAPRSRSRPTRIEQRGLEAIAFELRTPVGTTAGRARACPACTTSRTRSPPRPSRSRSARRSTTSPPASHASAPRSGASSGSRSTIARP